jgi:hypothetical protein
MANVQKLAPQTIARLYVSNCLQIDLVMILVMAEVHSIHIAAARGFTVTQVLAAHCNAMFAASAE